LSNLISSNSNLYIINTASEEKYYFSDETSLTAIHKNQLNSLKNNFKKIYSVDSSNNFLIQPKDLPNTFKKINFRKTINIDKDLTEKKDDISKNTQIVFFYNQNDFISSKKNTNHIGEIILKESFKYDEIEPIVNVVIFKNKVFISITKKNKILFYNQFEYYDNNYIKYILLVFEEYKLDRLKQFVNIIDGDSKSSNKKKELDNYFVKINFNKKSIFEIISKFYG
jgi:hypothetical protein